MLRLATFFNLAQQSCIHQKVYSPSVAEEVFVSNQIFYMENCWLGRDEPLPDPIRAYFWPTVNKRPTQLWPGLDIVSHVWNWANKTNELLFDLTRRDFSNRREKIENFVIFKRNFPNTNQRWLTQPDPDQKFLTQTHH